MLAYSLNDNVKLPIQKGETVVCVETSNASWYGCFKKVTETGYVNESQLNAEILAKLRAVKEISTGNVSW